MSSCCSFRNFFKGQNLIVNPSKVIIDPWNINEAQQSRILPITLYLTDFQENDKKFAYKGLTPFILIYMELEAHFLRDLFLRNTILPFWILSNIRKWLTLFRIVYPPLARFEKIFSFFLQGFRTRQIMIFFFFLLKPNFDIILSIIIIIMNPIIRSVADKFSVLTFWILMDFRWIRI